MMGYRAALEEAGLTYDERLVWHSELVEPSAYEVVWEQAPKHEFTALFAGSDVQALGAIRALRARGLRVPQDVAVTCVNDTDLARHSTPPLTTVDLHEYWLGYWAVKRLIQTIDGEETEHPILIPGDLIARESCGCRSILRKGRGRWCRKEHPTQEPNFYSKNEEGECTWLNGI